MRLPGFLNFAILRNWLESLFFPYLPSESLQFFKLEKVCWFCRKNRLGIVGGPFAQLAREAAVAPLGIAGPRKVSECNGRAAVDGMNRFHQVTAFASPIFLDGTILQNTTTVMR